MLVRALGIVLLFAGCASEQEIAAPPVDAWGENNPRDVETPVQVDRIRQVTRPEVDVLWTLDNSSSMSEEATKVMENFPTFLDYFIGSGLDYHIGIISTNMEMALQKGALQRADDETTAWIDEDTEDAITLFSQMIPLYPGVSHNESGRESIWTAIEVRDADYNAGFFRESAAQHHVVISDENDHSLSPPKDEFSVWLDEQRDPDQVTFSSIVGIEVPCNGSDERGTDYLDVTDHVGGFTWSICAADWAPAVDQLGLQAAGLKREYFLSRLPVVETIVVQVLFEEITLTFQDSEWTYSPERNSITFTEYVPDPLAEVQVTYDVLAGLQL